MPLMQLLTIKQTYLLLIILNLGILWHIFQIQQIIYFKVQQMKHIFFTNRHPLNSNLIFINTINSAFSCVFFKEFANIHDGHP